MVSGFETGEACAEALERHETTYVSGRCNALAIALHERFGLPIGCMWDANDGPSEGRSWMVHCYVLADDDHVIDVKGLRPITDVMDDWGMGPDDCWFERDLSVARARRLGGCPKGAVERATSDFAEVWPDFALTSAPSP